MHLAYVISCQDYFVMTRHTMYRGSPRFLSSAIPCHVILPVQRAYVIGLNNESPHLIHVDSS